MASLDDIRSRAEQFYQELEREHYLHGAGLKDELNATAIYERYADLSSMSLIEFLRNEFTSVQNSDENRKLGMLLETTEQTFLANTTKELIDQLQTTEANGVVQVDGEEMTFRSAAIRVMNEPNRKRRGAISTERDEFTRQHLNPLLEEIAKKTWDETGKLGHKNYVEMVQQQSGIDLFKLRELTESFLKESEDMYVDELGWFVKKELEIPLNELQRHDLSFIGRGTRFDALFPQKTMVDSILGFVKKMGIDPTAESSVRLDVEPRPKKSPRAFCSPVRVPEEVYLVIMPSGGADDYEAFMHELGHALHFGFVDLSIDWEYKRLGDNSITEGFAMTFDHLMQDRVWLQKVAKVSQPDDFLRHVSMSELMMVRRYCAKLSYELVLHDGGPLRGKEDLYKELLTNATKAEYAAAQYLSDVDAFFYCARYLRAWMLQSMFHQYLRENFNEDWFLNPRAGEFFRELWSKGQQSRAEEMCRHLSYPSLTMEFLKDKIESELAR